MVRLKTFEYLLMNAIDVYLHLATTESTRASSRLRRERFGFNFSCGTNGNNVFESGNLVVVVTMVGSLSS